MAKRIEDINFNLTNKMIQILLDFNNIKKELNSLELKLVEKRNQFIKEFRLNNKKEIEEYLSIKNK